MKRKRILDTSDKKSRSRSKKVLDKIDLSKVLKVNSNGDVILDMDALAGRYILLNSSKGKQAVTLRWYSDKQLMDITGTGRITIAPVVSNRVEMSIGKEFL